MVYSTPTLAIETSVISLTRFAFSSIALKALAQMINKYGDNGSHWRIPLAGTILPYGSPLIKIEYDTDVMSKELFNGFIWNK
jgi:hypothetical protein